MDRLDSGTSSRYFLHEFSEFGIRLQGCICNCRCLAQIFVLVLLVVLCHNATLVLCEREQLAFFLRSQVQELVSATAHFVLEHREDRIERVVHLALSNTVQRAIERLLLELAITAFREHLLLDCLIRSEDLLLHLCVHVLVLHALDSPDHALSALVEAVLECFALAHQVVRNRTALDIPVFFRNAAIFELLFHFIEVLILLFFDSVLPVKRELL